MMRVHGKDINDECQFCEKILECELFSQGHGIRKERSNIAKMMRCQFESRAATQRQWDVAER